MNVTDLAFANDIRSAYLRRSPRQAFWLVAACAGLLLSALLWASLAFVDEVARGQARVVPSRSIQIVQSLEGGIVEAIHVREGHIVAQGDVLMRIDDTAFSAQFGELRERRAALLARVTRLKAEAEGREEVLLPSDIPEHIATAERSLFDARQRKLKQDIDVLSLQEDQKKREADEARAQHQRIADTLTFMERETDITRKLFKEKVVPEIELLRIERGLAETRGQKLVLAATISRVDSAMKEAAARRSNAIASFRAMSEDDLSKASGDLAVVEENIRSARDRVRRTDLRSPVRGIVNKIAFNTIGAVIQPAQSLVEIVPLDDNLLLETRIKPSDIAFVRPEQSAVVKVTAYDSSIYGSLNGRVERISADTSTDDSGETFYRVMVRTDQNHLGPAATPLPISPGMVATVDVLTGRKTVIAYILKPIVKLRDEALREK
jgi:adhesin transport system membrane fusion protein